MANNATAFGSGRNRRPDPISQIGPGGVPGSGDPVAVMPESLTAINAALVRVEGVRIIGAGGVAAQPWRAVGLRLQANDPASMLFEVFLTAGDGRDLVIAVLDEEDAIASWRSAGAATLLPLMMQSADGAMTWPYPQLGPVALGPLHVRRQYSFLRNRRPRFLVRRKAVKAGLERVLVLGAEITGCDER